MSPRTIIGLSSNCELHRQNQTRRMALSDRRILVGVTGSVAAIRAPRLVSALRQLGAEVQVIVTDAAKVFVEKEGNLHCPIRSDQDEWHNWAKLGDPVLHIELRRWAELFVIAPLSANTLAKLSNGLCDNLLTCVARAWRVGEGGARPMLVAPAMNTEMWLHPITAVQINTITEWGVTVIPPVEKKLACGDLGVGAMEASQRIAEKITQLVANIGN